MDIRCAALTRVHYDSAYAEPCRDSVPGRLPLVTAPATVFATMRGVPARQAEQILRPSSPAVHMCSRNAPWAG